MRLWRSPRRWPRGATNPVQIRWKSHVSFPFFEGRWPSLIRWNRSCLHVRSQGCTYTPAGLPVRSQGCTLRQTPNQDTPLNLSPPSRVLCFILYILQETARLSVCARQVRLKTQPNHWTKQMANTRLRCGSLHGPDTFWARGLS